MQEETEAAQNESIKQISSAGDVDGAEITARECDILSPVATAARYGRKPPNLSREDLPNNACDVNATYRAAHPPPHQTGRLQSE
jgi:hypothetical protein